MGWALPRMITVVDISVLASFANVGLLIWFVQLLRREAGEPLRAYARP